MLLSKVYLKQLYQNVTAVKRKTKGKLFAVVKADAYGHGAARVSAFLEPVADGFCVADSREAGELLKAGITKPIIIFGTVYGDFDPPSAGNVVPTIFDLAEVRRFVSKSLFFPLVSIKINTGMNRLGIKKSELKAAVDLINAAGYGLYSVYSHLYDPVDEASSGRQLNIFFEALDLLRPRRGAIRHIAASGGIALGEKFYLDAVRPGLMLYGYGSSLTKPVQSVSAEIIKVFSVKKDECISYGGYTAEKDMRLAVVGAGYADGIRRKTRARDKTRFTFIGGKKCGIVGQVCMDVSLVDVSKTDISAGRAYFLGNGVSFDEVFRDYKTNEYEVLTGLNQRVKRVYVE